jgi:hypothetical protein
VDGKLKSRLERDVAARLPKGTLYESEALKYVLYKTYTPDFVFTRKDGTKLYIEVKGYLRPEDRTKMIAVKALNPDLDIRFFFPVDNKLRKGSKSRYSDWCQKHGFPYAIGRIPKNWFSRVHVEEGVAGLPGTEDSSR